MRFPVFYSLALHTHCAPPGLIRDLQLPLPVKDPGPLYVRPGRHQNICRTTSTCRPCEGRDDKRREHRRPDLELGPLRQTSTDRPRISLRSSGEATADRQMGCHPFPFSHHLLVSSRPSTSAEPGPTRLPAYQGGRFYLFWKPPSHCSGNEWAPDLAPLVRGDIWIFAGRPQPVAPTCAGMTNGKRAHHHLRHPMARPWDPCRFIFPCTNPACGMATAWITGLSPAMTPGKKHAVPALNQDLFGRLPQTGLGSHCAHPGRQQGIARVTSTCRPCEGRGPVNAGIRKGPGRNPGSAYWIFAFAGMTIVAFNLPPSHKEGTKTTNGSSR
jgi:hypothetical protein